MDGLDMNKFQLVSCGEGGLAKCIEDLSLRVGSTIIAPIMEEIVDKKGGVGSATRVAEVTISNNEGKLLVYVGRTRSRPLLESVERALGEAGNDPDTRLGVALEARTTEAGDTEAALLFTDKAEFLGDLRHLYDWADESGRMSAGFVSDMVAFFRQDVELRRSFVMNLVASGKAVCEGCHKAMKLKGDNAALRCSRCKCAFYCSKACQRLSYSGHRRFCTPCPEGPPFFPARNQK